MAISFSITSDNVDNMIDDLKRIFPPLLTGSPLPPMQEQPKENREPAPATEEKTVTNTARASDKPGSRTRKKTEEVKVDVGEFGVVTVEPCEKEASAAATSTPAPDASEQSKPAETPDIDAVRNALKTLGATDGLGHDKVFEVLGRYKATNASSVPEDRRAELIAEIEALLKGTK